MPKCKVIPFGNCSNEASLLLRWRKTDAGDLACVNCANLLSQSLGEDLAQDRRLFPKARHVGKRYYRTWLSTKIL